MRFLGREIIGESITKYYKVNWFEMYDNSINLFLMGSWPKQCHLMLTSNLERDKFVNPTHIINFWQQEENDKVFKSFWEK